MAAAGPGAPAGPPKPRLKINVNRTASFVTDTPPSAGTATPGEGGGSRKVKLKLSASTPATPGVDPSTPVKTKAGRQPKPTQKLVESKKRQRDDDDDDDMPLAASAPPATKIKIRQAKAAAAAAAAGGAHTQLVLKARGRPPVHPAGDGYDSEASDRELDPAIEEQFILRMPPGEHSDYVRAMMEAGKVGLGRQQGGASLSLKFFDEESHRAVVTVKGQLFAAVMVDLPTITESMKTWDKKSFLKSADVCQMLLAFQPVQTEEEAKKAPLPAVVDAAYKWPHGLTPPMHDCVNRRFAKTISRKEIEDKEQEVERLLGEDAMADRTAWEWVDESNEGGAAGGEEEEEDAEGEDAEGELNDGMGYFGAEDGAEDVGDLDLEADLEAAFADDVGVADTPATGMDFGTPVMTTQANTPAAHPSIELDESEESDEDEDDEDDDEDLDEDQRAARDEAQGVKDFINDLRKQLAHRRADLDKTQNKILRQRLESQIKQLKSEIELKMSSIGMEVDDD
ncbi:transcription initiation factor TFIID subunit 7 [Cordyceps militaris CM01]|uniref:Transcription initiation factor TFIID subunit 7 n=2 Tax=Cordyceps militaris TaxID=73501 RepID=G3J2Q1_CORMM|nr:transcription initiation factor TFIID subunit 7 [Cordyceps militaris CM01]ATY63177.1 transcription initiation factor TFIID subunit 7 [Cordyceps militaris]EGX96385.1 transcription initiation factor TFIID subunit 7 [Cordyceps militaris CM01]